MRTSEGLRRPKEVLTLLEGPAIGVDAADATNGRGGVATYLTLQRPDVDSEGTGLP